jgi:riboflavin synthase
VFTGIVEELGEVLAWTDLPDAARITVAGPVVTSDVAPGDSIAVNGVCLTVVESGPGSFTADVMKETLVRSSLGDLVVGSPVNLERAVRLQDRLGGHLVQGHVDGTGDIVRVEPDQHWTVVTISLPAELSRYVVEKGSITVDGVSLTVSAVGHTELQVSLVPTTLERTTLGRKTVGDPVNLEVDITAKYVEKLLAAGTVPGSSAGARGDT